MYIIKGKEVIFLTMVYGAATNIGKRRKVNEDSFLISELEDFPYILVADGMGGHKAGEIASIMAVETIKKHLEKNLKEGLDYVEAGEEIRQAFIAANSSIYTYSKNHNKVMGMGTTATLAMVYRGKLITAHVGDSRVYTAGSKLLQVTKDHSYVQELLLRGEITPEQAKNHPQKNYITRAMGVEDIVKVDIGIKAYKGEKILVCSDGLTNMLEDDEILKLLKTKKSVQERAEMLVDAANSAGGLDNITVAVMEKE